MNLKQWKKNEELLTKDLKKRTKALTPEMLFESYYLEEKKVCLICCNKIAASTLWSSYSSRSIVPMCEYCSTKWNSYGYYTLKNISVFKTLYGLMKYKLFHFFSKPSFFGIIKDLYHFYCWATKMQKIKKMMKESKPKTT